MTDHNLGDKYLQQMAHKGLFSLIYKGFLKIIKKKTKLPYRRAAKDTSG